MVSIHGGIFILIGGIIVAISLFADLTFFIIAGGCLILWGVLKLIYNKLKGPQQPAAHRQQHPHHVHQTKHAHKAHHIQRAHQQQRTQMQHRTPHVQHRAHPMQNRPLYNQLCPRCGTVLNPQSNFCSGCGARLKH